jgi:hypothetical protein
MGQQVRVTVRQHQPPDQVASLRPLTFSDASAAAELLASTIHVFATDDAMIGLSFVTAAGTVNLTLPPRLAAQVADGIQKLNQALLPEPKRRPRPRWQYQQQGHQEPDDAA